MLQEEEVEVDVKGACSQGRRRQPLWQRKIAKQKNVMVGAVVAVVAVAARGGRKTLYGEEEDAHLQILHKTVGRLQGRVDVLEKENVKLKRTAHATAELASIQEIQTAFLKEMDDMTTQRLSWATERDALLEEKYLIEQSLQITRNVFTEELTGVVPSPEDLITAILHPTPREQPVADQSRITNLEEKLRKSQSDAGRYLALLASHGVGSEGGSEVYTPISHKQYRVHLEQLQKKLQAAKQKITRLQWEATHHPDLEHASNPPPVDEVSCDPQKIDDLVYLNASLLEQLRGKEKELVEVAANLNEVVAMSKLTVKNLESRVVSVTGELVCCRKEVGVDKKELHLAQDENIRLARKVSSLGVELKRAQSGVESTDIEELKELNQTLLEENHKLKQAWADFGVPPEGFPTPPSPPHHANIPSPTWGSWTDKAKDLTNIFLNPSYIKQATRFGTPTVPASSVPSMHGPS